MKRSVWRQARRLVREHRRRLVGALALLIVGRLAALTVPASAKWLVDEVVARGRTELLTGVVVVALVATVVQSAAMFAVAQLVGLAAQRAIAEMRVKLHRRVMQMPIPAFDETQTGVLLSRIMSDPEAIRNLIGTGLANFVTALSATFAGILVLLWLDWRLTVAVVAPLALLAVSVAGLGVRVRPLFHQLLSEQAEVSGRLAQALSGIRVVKAYAAEPRESEVFHAGVTRVYSLHKRIRGLMSASDAAATLCLGVVWAVLVLVGGREILAGRLSVGEFVMYGWVVGLMAAPLSAISADGMLIAEAFVALSRVGELLEARVEAEGDSARVPVPRLSGNIRFEDVWFEYVPGKPAVQGVTFDAPQGSTTALVGPSGAGKTTIVNLLMAFLHPTRGYVSVDGYRLSTARLRDYRLQLGSVMQDTFLFDGTVTENVAYARPGACARDVEAACRLAHCDDFVAALPQGYGTRVGERGVRLSGGQRQRLAIARAILADPRVLILDEATSHLDAESEYWVQRGLRYLRDNRTTVVIAHRLSTIQSADQVLVVDKGRIVDRGTHADLVKRGGPYAELCRTQNDTDTVVGRRRQW